MWRSFARVAGDPSIPHKVKATARFNTHIFRIFHPLLADNGEGPFTTLHLNLHYLSLVYKKHCLSLSKVRKRWLCESIYQKANIANNIPPHNRHVTIVVRIPAIYPFQIPLRSSSMARCKLQKLCQEWQMDDGTFGDNEILVTSSVSVWLVSIFFQPPQHTIFLQRTRKRKKSQEKLAHLWPAKTIGSKKAVPTHYG